MEAVFNQHDPIAPGMKLESSTPLGSAAFRGHFFCLNHQTLIQRSLSARVEALWGVVNPTHAAVIWLRVNPVLRHFTSPIRIGYTPSCYDLEVLFRLDLRPMFLCDNIRSKRVYLLVSEGKNHVSLANSTNSVSG